MAKLTGTNPGQVPTNGDLGTMAYQDKDNVKIDGGSINLKDNNKLQLGDSSDLQVYHDSNNSYISEQGQGVLYIQGSNNVQIESATGENMAVFLADSAVELYYDNSKKFETTSVGVDVTGTVTATSYAGDGSALTGIGPSTTVGDVGTYATLRHTSVSTSLNPGDTISGGTMRYSGAYGPYGSAGNTAPSGTWRCMGYLRTNSGYSTGYTTTFVRIS